MGTAAPPSGSALRIGCSSSFLHRPPRVNFRRRLYIGPSKKTTISATYRTGGSVPYQRYADSVLFGYGGKKPKAVVQFIGGAFVGATPEIAYSYFLELLAKQGFLILAAPYKVTFDHGDCARELHGKWTKSLALLMESGCPPFGVKPDDVRDLPRLSIGHSNGALMQALIGSYFQNENLPQANVIVSFNNKQATDAVPFFDQLGPSISQLQAASKALPYNELANYLAGEAAKTFADPPFPLPLGIERESLRKFTEQIPSVFGQVADGVSEFRPTPQQNRRTICTSYGVPHTLLVKFNVDAIDETDVLERLLKTQIDKIGGTLSKIVLNGTHLTPLAVGLQVQPGNVFTPVDAVAQAVAKASFEDLRVLARRINSWFDDTVRLL